MASLQPKTVKGITYWYIIESKRINGKVKTGVVEYIGNTEKLKARFNEQYKNQNGKLVIKSYIHGSTHALQKIINKLGIEEILDECFAPRIRDGVKRSVSLILIAIARMCAPGSKDSFPDWVKRTTLPEELNIKKHGKLNCNHFWDQMDDIPIKALQEAENRIVERIIKMYDIKLDKLALDFTNYFTYISTSNIKNTLTKRNKNNKQKRSDLRQFQYAIVTTKEFTIPLYSFVYSGKDNDKTAFKNYIENLKERIPNYESPNLTFVFDGGGTSKNNLELVPYYICRFSLSSCKELYDKELNETITLDKGKEISCKRLRKIIWGEDRTGILTFSEKLYRGQVAGLESNILKTIEDIKNQNIQLANPKKRIDTTKKIFIVRVGEKILNRDYMSDVFNIIYNVDKNDKVETIEYEINEDVVSEIKEKYFGKKLIITNRHDWSTEEILQTYFDQDAIEGIFKDSKEEEFIGFTPQFHWTDQKMIVNMFCSTLGLQLLGVLNKELSDKGIKITNKKLMATTERIREVWTKVNNNSKVNKQLEEMDDFEKKVWEAIKEI
jgi:transposase